MCGILGIVSPSGVPIETTDPQVLQMRETMRSRGPDDAGCLRISPNAVLAHRRLAIRDLSQGQQPWTSFDGRWSLVYNGEIYNTDALRDLTSSRFTFPLETRCDTELLLRLIQAEEENAPRYLRGMFAFGAYDAQTRRLILARDRFGVKPLYYAWCGHELVFASSASAICKHPRFSPRLNRKVLSHYLLTLRQNFGEETLWEGIFLLPPAHVLVADETGTRVSRYWDYPQSTDESSLVSEQIERLDALISTAVECRLVSDVPVGMMLSGGIDSCLLGSYVQQYLGKNFAAECGIGKSVSNELSGEAVDAEASARFLGCRFRSVEVDEEAYRRSWRNLVKENGLPLATPSDVIIYELARSLKQKVGVVLGGEGADELFGGYTAIHGLGWELDRSGSNINPLAELLERYFSQASLISWPGQNVLLKENSGAIEQAIRAYYFGILRSGYAGKTPAFSAVRRLLHQVNLESLLMRLDQATMSASLEGRVPYTDHLLVEAFWNLPAEYCFHLNESGGMTSAQQWEERGKLQSKWLLRSLARTRLPEEIASRRKRSFPTPVPAWLASCWTDWAREMLLDSPLLKELCWRQPLEELAENPQAAGVWLWPLLNLAIWEQESGLISV